MLIKAPRVLLYQPPGTIRQIGYNDAAIQYSGRWIDTGSGKWSGWASSAISITVSGTLFVDVVCSVIDINATDYCAILYTIDNNPSELTGITLTSAAHIFSGSLVGSIPLSDTGSHVVTIQIMGVYASQYATTNKMTLTKLQIDSNGSYLSGYQGTVNLQVVGDSWAAGYNGWTRLLDRNYFKYNCVATPGFQITHMTPQYKYNYSGSINTTDPTFAGIVIMFGVNEYNAGVSTAQFKTNMLALIDEIRLRQPTAKIIMVRTPSHGALDYGQYGTVLSEIPALRTNTYYYSTTSLDASLAAHWLDAGHLNATGKTIIANALSDYLKTPIGL